MRSPSVGWAIVLLGLTGARSAAEVDFASQIRPILQSRCVKCHGPEKTKGRLRLDSREGALKNGVVIPGNSTDSTLIHVLEDGDMPPEGEGAPLSKQQIALLRAWINEGARWGGAPAKEKPAVPRPSQPEAEPGGRPEPAREPAPVPPGPRETVEFDLPPGAGRVVDYSRDIQPLLQRNCLKCHGPEKPKGSFRLDNREAALQGGRSGVAIIPGNSAGSPLIHFVARQVAGMEMPPAESGEALTEQEVALLRAWIDQGARWGEAAEPPNFTFSITPMMRWYSVRGNEQKFREQAWLREGWSGGLGRFTLENWIDPDTRLTAEGAVDAPGNHDFRFALQRQDVGFVRGGVEQFRSYSNNYGGYYEPFESLQGPAFRLDRNLHLDSGRVWTEVGIAPPHWPEITLGYEYRYKRGEVPTLHWGPSTQDGTMRKIHPAFKELDQTIHIVRADLRYDWAGLEMENNFMAEFLDSGSRRLEVSPRSFGATPDTYTTIAESHDSFQLANTFSLQKEIKDWWLLSGGYYYSYLDADAAFRQNTINGLGEPIVGQHWFSQPIVLDWMAHIFNASTRLGPWRGLTLSAGVQGNWEQQDAIGNSTLFFGLPDPTMAIPPFLVSTVSSDKQSVTTTEHAALRYDRIPHTVLFAEAELEQGRTDYFEQDLGAQQGFLRDTESRSRDQDYRAGVTWSPWPRVTLNSHYRYRLKETRYDHLRDIGAGGGPNPGYSAFILGRDLETHEFQARLGLRPAPWLRTLLTYQAQATDYMTDTDAVTFGIPSDPPGGWLLAGNYDASIYSLNMVLTPWERLSLDSSFSLHDSRTRTASNGDPAVDDYEGEVYTFLVGGNFMVDDKTSLAAHYSFSQGDFSQDNAADGLPLGIEYRQHGLQVGLATRLSENLSAQLQYQFQHYREPTAGDVNDYSAHGVFVNFTLNWK